MADHTSDAASREVLAKVVGDATKDPGLPRHGPTEAFWQLPASDLSNQQSSALPAKTRYAIIGSGITACSVAQNLLQLTTSDSDATVTVLEARTLCSGATGRNGGHLQSLMRDAFVDMEKYLGRNETTKIARFANNTLEKMHQLAGDEPGSALSLAAEARRVTAVGGYWDQETFKAAQESFRRYEECIPEHRGNHEVYGPEEAREKFGMKDAVGVITNSAGAFWPYRLITGLFQRLLERYVERFSIEAETPVISVLHEPSSDEEYPYILTTPRGTLRATKVIHCTNGWTGHLLPKLRGKIFPLCGTMSVQAAGADVPNEGQHKSWSAMDKPTYNANDNTFSYGLYYITQNAHTGDIFIGGEKQLATEFLSSDDTRISTTSKNKLESVLPTIFDKGWPNDQKPEVKSLWSGIMGYTPDHLPWVGQIPESYTSRGGDGEWIAAGFNGYGMPLCWGCGEAVAKMLLGGEDVSSWVPASFLITRKRLESPYSDVEVGIARMLGLRLGWAASWRFGWRAVRDTVHQNLLARLG